VEILGEFLQRTPFFGGLVDEALDRVIAMLVERRFVAGESVVREGEPGSSMFIIRAGELVVCKNSGSGNLVRLVRLGPGDFFGETALIAVQPRNATVIAEAPSQLYELTARSLYRLYQDDIQSYVMVLQNMNRELSRRLRGADQRITDLADESGDTATQIRRHDPK
jgi:CRP/FNR family cyclic AMP-dependent transcriptional regulator